MKNIAILGSTGSVGQNAVAVALEHPNEFRVLGLSAHTNIHLLKKQTDLLNPEKICLSSTPSVEIFSDLYPHYQDRLCVGSEGLNAIVSLKDVDLILIAIVGSAGLEPLWVALEHNKDIAFVNKEALVICGETIMDIVRKKNIRFLPVDSEHSAIYQCLAGENKETISKLILTASGGPFYGWTKEEKLSVTPAMAVKHPQWNMGAKISVDSATFMNKGLEIIEAHHLFNMPLEKIRVTIHPESIVHSMVEFVDGSVKAQLGVSDMKIPIAYALAFPQRLPLKNLQLDFPLKNLTFKSLQTTNSLAIDMAYQACRSGGTHPLALSVSNDVAVQSFLDGHISFIDILNIVENILENHSSKKKSEL